MGGCAAAAADDEEPPPSALAMSIAAPPRGRFADSIARGAGLSSSTTASSSPEASALSARFMLVARATQF